MARSLKPQLKGGVNSDIFLNRNNLMFFADVAGTRPEIT